MDRARDVDSVNLRRELLRVLLRGEAALLRVEGGLIVVLVLTMLVLAGYNIVYRNVLVPLQSHWAHSGPPVTEMTPAPRKEVAKADGETKSAAPKKEGSGAEGFGGAFGEPDPALEDEEEEQEGDDAQEEPPEAADEGSGGDDGAGGFGGAFGKPPPKESTEPAKGDDAGEPEDDLDDQFANLPDIDTSHKDDSGEPEGGPPPEGSFAAWGVEFITKLRMDWIDVLLRQLVIIASFLGAALATARKKHINIDALSKVLPPHIRRWVNVATTLLAIGVCVVLASAGKKLVAISREFPVEVTPFADEWHFQLMFPIGFGLVAAHFVFRLFAQGEPERKDEAGSEPESDEEPEPEAQPEGSDADAEEKA